MIHTIFLEESGQEIGSIIYDDEKSPVEYELLVEKDSSKNRIEKYLKTKREFYIPESDQLDDYRLDTALPTDNGTYFELALSELFAKLRIKLGRYKEGR
jgi:hypothetical protein